MEGGDARFAPAFGEVIGIGSGAIGVIEERPQLRCAKGRLKSEIRQRLHQVRKALVPRFTRRSSYPQHSARAHAQSRNHRRARHCVDGARQDAVETAWKFVMPILGYWEQERALNLPEYQCGTWGPVEADRLIEADGRTWRTL